MSEFVRDRVPLVAGLLTVLSLALVFGAIGGVVPRGQIPRPPGDSLAAIPHVNAGLSLLAIATILTGVRRIRRHDVTGHRRAMLAALGLFATFLCLYLYRIAIHGPAQFGGPDLVYTYVYLPLLAIHILLAIVCIPLLYYVVLLGLTRSPAVLGQTLHPRVGHVAAGLWLVSFTLGIVVYGMLYWVYPLPA